MCTCIILKTKTSKGIYYYKTYNNNQITAVKMNKKYEF